MERSKHNCREQTCSRLLEGSILFAVLRDQVWSRLLRRLL